MNECIYAPCLRCSPRCLPIDTPEAHKEHAQIVEEIRLDSKTADDEIVNRKAVRTPEGIEMGKHLARLCDVAEAEQRKRFPNHATRCQTCAFRAGTLPNGDPVTLMDAMKCLIEHVPFMCHQYFNPDGTPRDMCAGYALLQFSGKSKPGKAPWDFSGPPIAEPNK